MLNRKIYALSVAAGLLVGTLGIIPISAVVESQQNEIIQEVEDSHFSDVLSSDWFYTYVEYLAKNNIVNGMTNTEFVPSGTFTVAESAAIITRYLGLEDEAAERKKAMEVLDIAGSEKWYAGYMQLMHEAGIIDVSEYGCTVYDKHISIDSFELLEAPIKRYEFAAFVTRSFELDGTEIRTGPEKTGLGHEFIYGGEYNESILEKYIPYINDYNSIPAEYNYYVLKAYYNGIFNGDNLGNFNPLNNLSRAEMAKVTAVIIDASLRERIDVSKTLRESYVFSDESFDEKKGSKYLKPVVSDMMLQNEASGVVVTAENNLPIIVYDAKKNAPDGYSIKFYHYTKDKSGYDINIAGTPDLYDQHSYKNTYSVGDRFILTLSDSKNGETIDAYEFTLLAAGLVREDNCAYLP